MFTFYDSIVVIIKGKFKKRIIIKKQKIINIIIIV